MGTTIIASWRRHSPPAYGETVRVVGFPETDLFRINISEAIWRREPSALPPEEPPQPYTAESLLMDDRGQLKFRPFHFGHTLKLKGQIPTR